MNIEKNLGFVPPCSGAIEVMDLSGKTRLRAVRRHNNLPENIRSHKSAWAVEGTKCSGCSFRIRVAFNGKDFKEEVAEWENCPVMQAGSTGVIYRSFR